MPEVLRVLYVDDEAATAQQAKDLYDESEIAGYKIEFDTVTDFDKAINQLSRSNYDIVILDVYQGKPALDNDNLKGKEVLERIKATTPVTVIMYTALPAQVKDLKSPMVKVLSKAEDDLGKAIEREIESGIPAVKHRLLGHINSELTKYYWGFAEDKADLLATTKDDHLFEYLVARSLASTLDGEGATKLFGGTIDSDNVHPWRMYIIPPSSNEASKMGQIVLKDGTYRIVLTPSCDFANNKAAYVLTALCDKLEGNQEVTRLLNRYKADTTNPGKKAELAQFLKSNTNDRHFFLPSVDILDLPSLVIDLQSISSIEISELRNSYVVTAELDTPYAQDLQAKFTRYNNRPGTPDIDTEHLISNL